jgi:ribosomal protein L11
MNKYQREITQTIKSPETGNDIEVTIVIDVYDILYAYTVTNPALQHLIKKALMPGDRGHKTIDEDLQEILHSARRAIEIHDGSK